MSIYKKDRLIKTVSNSSRRLNVAEPAILPPRKKLSQAILSVLMMGGMLPAVAFAASIQGLKFNDTNANGVRDANESVLANQWVMLRNDTTADYQEQKTDANGKYSFTNLPSGNYIVWTGIDSGSCQTVPVTGTGQVLYTLSLGQQSSLDVNFGTSQKCATLTTSDPCKSPNFISKGSGKWDEPATWNKGKVPGAGDRVQIKTGHVISFPNSKIELGTGGLCNLGTLQSGDNVLGQTATKVEIRASKVHNEGSIVGKDGIHSNCGQPASSGSNIIIFGSDVTNTTSGQIKAGNGGNSPAGAKHPCPAQRCGEGQNSRGGNGGSVEIYSATTINKGTVISGNGGNAGAAHGQAIGGDGGVVRITTNASDPNNQSTSGPVVSGNGGVVCAPHAGWLLQNRGLVSAAGKAGDITAIIKELTGKWVGKPGSVLYYDPIHLKAGSDLRIESFETVEIYTDEGGTIDLTQLTEGAISAKTIRIITKSLDGEGGSVDLRGISGKVFKADRVEIFADQIEMDEGVTVQSLVDAPAVTVSPGKIPYRVTLNGDSQMIGDPDQVLFIPLRVTNSGPKTDTYNFTVTDSAGWILGTLPSATIDGFQVDELSLDVTLPEQFDQTDDITITATSEADSTVVATLKVTVGTNPGADLDGDNYPDSRDVFPNDVNEWFDSDKDGMGDNADLDDDDDGMPDLWEQKYEALSCAVNDADQDADSDGYSNFKENLASTNPEDPSSKPGGTNPGEGKVSAFGKVVDALNFPVAGATIQLEGQTVTTDAEGNWTLTGLPEGKPAYVATLTGEGYQSQVLQCQQNKEGKYGCYSQPLHSSLQLKVGVSPSSIVGLGENLTYTLTVTNTGTQTATGVGLQDVLPAGTQLVSLQPLNGGSCDTNTVSCTLPDLTAGASTKVKLVVKPTAVSKLENTVKATANNYPAEVAKAWTEVKPLLSVTTKDTPDPVNMLDKLHYAYQVELSKSASAPATGVSLVSQLPSGVELQTAKTEFGECDTSSLPTVRCPLPDMAVGSSTAVNLEVLLKDAGMLLLTNDATVTAANYPAHTFKERTHIFVPDNIKIDMVFVIDTTNSMQEEIDGVVVAIKKFIAEVDPSQRPTAALVTFKDDVKVEAFTQDLNVLLGAAEKLQATGGSTCPEASAEALGIAIKHLQDGGVLMLATDASPYESADVTGLADQIRAKNMKFHALVTGDCSQEGSWNELTK